MQYVLGNPSANGLCKIYLRYYSLGNKIMNQLKAENENGQILFANKMTDTTHVIIPLHN
ncbi:MAG: hypothetical protein QM642_00310 [Edaphocola sp.]